MKNRNLIFAEPTAEKFVEALSQIADRADISIQLIGAGTLADSVAQFASERDIPLDLRTEPAAPASAVPSVIVFAELNGARLADGLLGCLDLDADVLAPITDRHFSRNPLFLISIPKAGTHLLLELVRALDYADGIALPMMPNPQTWYCLEHTTTHTPARSFFTDLHREASGTSHPFPKTPVLFIYRHPLDVLVSEAHYYHQVDKTIYAGWLSGKSFEERLDALIAEDNPIGSTAERLSEYVPWFDFPNVIALSFEELAGERGGGHDDDQERLIWSILLKLQAPGNPRQIAERLFNPNSPTFRKGQAGAYRDRLCPAFLANFVSKAAPVLRAFGYPIDGSYKPSSRVEEQLSKPVVLTEVDNADTTVLVEGDFLACNIVRFQNRLYALPQAAGPISLPDLPDAVRDKLPNADDLVTLKATVVLGAASLAARQHALDQLARNMAQNDEFSASHGAPRLLQEHRAYNVFAVRDYFCAIKQSAGPVDPSLDVAELLQNHQLGDILVGRDIATLLSQIDRLVDAANIRNEAVDHGPPRLLQTHRTYNVLVVRDQLCAIRQSIGTVDLSLDATELLSNHNPGDILFGRDIATLLSQVDLIVEAESTRTDLEAAVRELSERVAALEAGPSFARRAGSR